ncbi:alkanesulfonate monooxygenase SsuD/methylene tetrahydromethanopterin reductase-like flavin-dependent oxidoreductase (luciferase family)/GNAT superfamily N-acetyltransferase [Conyzicola lurida]|uniref:Alkanesulfonate monooxygenase SsuD/methylene tetrahydromethanopterin reductase-like flavin-dependent oxidoreductase (Luciferase family)/GNAT superfamily N-acetyltransferase n=1 Tax=Conyzicola lurida TaxID=1172621 RepID=A0A841AM87_9MICO|nr:LLM class flavin-dependent oxidoreductase [Conyzicola lurida]MBB5842826.1 alkanesulfonate monooxygenase SsuD/methylene tetrahydromethanopterin reductase-like flavin-dependent oxidoreductase (luciferase family)/GNAT superfamily N-acetyltransferase [Conyzicola lurida]
MTIEIRESHWDSPEAVGLRREMDAEIHPRYADLFEGTDAPPAVDTAAIVFTLVAFDGDQPVATASLKNTDGFSEVKRVFVAGSHRRQNLAARILAAVEQRALALGVSDLVLQTGLRQPEAIALYEREGWMLIPPFGPYAHDTVVSRCFAKPLAPLVVAVELPAVGAAATLVPQTLAALSGFADAGVDLAIIADDLRAPADGLARVDAATLAAFAAPVVPRIGLAPAIPTTHSEPFHLSKAVQTLDHASLGRAAWQVTVSTSAEEAAFFGRKAAVDEDEAWAEAEEAIEVAERLWDSWEDDAEIRDVASGRFIDRDRVHHIDFEGRFFSVRGPSIVPRSPQGRPPIVISATSAASLDVAARRADVIRVEPSRVAAARAAVAEAGRAGAVTVLVDVAVASGQSTAVRDTLATLRHHTGADGAVLVFADTPTDDLAPAIAPFTREATGTLRDRLGLARPASRYIRTLEGAAL